jgi:hypothetical protein
MAAGYKKTRKQVQVLLGLEKGWLQSLLANQRFKA